jgi:glucosamine--fructose-6-phosphate aminotransferase (isomerizing)
MCGIYGHIGTSNSIEKCLKGLKFLEYRGYDSAGIAGIDNGDLLCFKEKGKISELEKRLENKLHSFQSSIGHTRWATHGKATQTNAHPHLDQKKEVAVVHNGILENYRSLRSMLEGKGVQFESETDTEVIVQLIAHFYKGDLVAAVQQSLTLMKGFWGLAVIHKNHPGQILATCYENPIVIGISKDKTESFISSDPHAFTRKDIDLFFLKNHEIAIVSKEKVDIFDRNCVAVEKTPEAIEVSNFEISKGDFKHYMLKEVFEQPHAIRSAIHNRFLLETGEVEFENFSYTNFKQILFLACGSSWHAGCIAAQQFEELAHIPARAEIASEYRYRQAVLAPDTLVVAISQSGETFDTVAAVRLVKEKGAKVLAICNVPSSTLMREADYSILLRAGPEISVCSTKAVTCMLAVLSLLALKFARVDRREVLEQILELPQAIELVLEQKDQIAALAKKYASKSVFIFIGRQYMYPTCQEAALKLKEISYVSAFAYPAGELKHGSIALVDSNCVVIGLCGNSGTYDKVLSNLTEVKARGGQIIAFAPIDGQELDGLADDVIRLPKLPEALSPLLYMVASQLLAYFIAEQRGTEIDQPRNLAKSVTVE